MSQMVLTVGPAHSLREVARLMSERHVGAAVVIDPDGNGPGIITERDILRSIGAGQDPDREVVAEHLTRDVVFAAPDWSLEEAAAAMVRGGFRHLIVLEQRRDRGDPVGARRRPLLDRGRCDLPGAREGGRGVGRARWAARPAAGVSGRAAQRVRRQRAPRAGARRFRGGCL